MRRGVDHLLAESGFEGQLLIGDFSERDIGETETGRIFHKRAMTEHQLPYAARDHVDEDLLIRNDDGRGFDEFGFHIG